MLGGGTWSVQNKVLPGSYINYVSAQRASLTISDRGVGALPIELNWGADNKVFEVSAETLEDNCMKVFGYALDANEMLPIREFFKHAVTGLFYRLNSGNKASCTYSNAKHSGTRGNDIKHVINANIDDASLFDVVTYLGDAIVDTQTVANATELADNDYVSFVKSAVLEATAGVSLSGGTNGTVTGTQHSEALAALESYQFNGLGCMSDTEAVKSVYAEYTKRMRDMVGAKFQLIAHNHAHDYLGTINVKNTVADGPTYALVPWLLGAEVGCAINKTCENMKYDGEYTINADYTQNELKAAIKAGELVLHKVGSDIHILSDINSYVSVTEEMNEDFQLNQVIRVLDQIANDIAAIFNQRFLGKVQNDTDGRISFWSACVDVHNELLKLKAIEDFKSEDITVSKGEGKRSVIEIETVKPVCAMSHLYMSVQVN